MVDLRELIQKVSQVKDKSELQILKTQFLGKIAKSVKNLKTWLASRRNKKGKSNIS